MTETQLHYATIARTDLADVLRGKAPTIALPFETHLSTRMGEREVIVFWTGNSRRPCIICVGDDDREELFNWAFNFHSELSPLTSWCHVISRKELDRMGAVGGISPNLFGLEAAWAGAVIAEAMIVTRRNFDTISLPLCSATDTFAIARTLALYGAKGSLGTTIERLDLARDKLRRSVERWRPTTSLAISALVRVLPDAPQAPSRIVDYFSRACRHLHEAGMEHGSEDDQEPRLTAELLREAIEFAPELSNLESLSELSAEDRVRLLREIKAWIGPATNEDARNVLFFAAGYVMSRIGGAERDLRLAETFGEGHPHVLTWATVLGGLGAATYWADTFGGIGRLVARELSRAFYLWEPPLADISADELLVIAADEKSGRNRFRTGQRSVAAISVRHGVVVQLAIADEERSKRNEESGRPVPRVLGATEGARDLQLQSLAEQLFPYLRQLLIRSGLVHAGKEKRSSSKSKSPQLFKDK